MMSASSKLLALLAAIRYGTTVRAAWEANAQVLDALPSIAALLAITEELHFDTNGYCSHCGGEWPCSEGRALAALNEKLP
jgi:hypothetical protein